MTTLRAEIEAMFAGLNGYAQLEDAYARAHSSRLAKERDRRAFAKRKPRRGSKPAKSRLHILQAWLKSLTAEQLREIRTREWQRRKADPVRYDAKKKQNRERMSRQYHEKPRDERCAAGRAAYHLAMRDAGYAERRRARNREYMRRYRAARA